MNTGLPKIIITDDHDMFRDALKTMLDFDSIADVIGLASNGQELLELLEVKKPDIILMDIDMPILNGIEATKQVVEKYPDVKVLALSMFGDEKYYKEMIEAGAAGFLLKSSGKSELERAIKKVNAGESYFSNDLLRDIISRMGQYKETEREQEKSVAFTDREIEILQYMCLGHSTQEISEEIFLSAKTIENYRVKLLKKTGSKNSIGLVVYAIKNNVVSI